AGGGGEGRGTGLGGGCRGLRVFRPVAPDPRLRGVLRSQPRGLPEAREQTRPAQPHAVGRVGQFYPIRSSSAVGQWATVKTRPMKGTRPMKRTFALVLAALAGAALFGGLVHAVLVAAHVSEPAAPAVCGLPPGRLGAPRVVVRARVGAVMGGLALARPASRFGTASGRLGAILALVAGLIAAVNGGLNLAVAN